MSNFDELGDGPSAELETRLRQDLERVPAPDGFADRVMSRVAVQQRKGWLMTMPKRTPGFLGGMAIAAMLLVGIVLGGWQWKQQEIKKERQQAENVQRQFDVAMEVTQRTLAEVQERVGKAVRETVKQ